jgi:UDP-glucuronate 4-epimerase
LSQTVLVTGAAGFIGSHTAEALLKRGDTVVGLDNLNDYYSPERKRANLAEVRAAIPDAEAFLYVEGDIRDRDLVKQLFGRHRFDTVIHLAAMAGVRASRAEPLLYYDVNLSGTINLLQAAGLGPEPKPNFVFASSSSVYGHGSTVPFKESEICDRPLAPYPASKRAGEMLGYSYHHLYQLPFTGLRFFTVYGPRNRPDMMPQLILNNIFFEATVPLYNAGDMKRDWTYVDDIVAGVLAAADRPLGYCILNLGRGEPVDLRDFIQAVENCAGKRARLDPAPMDSADVQVTWADISRARELLGYAPRTPVDEGVHAFWQWYRKAILNEGI